MKTIVKIRLGLAAGAIVIAVVAFWGIRAAVQFSPAGQFTILYSLDRKQNDQALVKAIAGAHRFVYFAIYAFTKRDIADALIAAKERGLDVEGIADAEQSSMPLQAKILASLRAAGIPMETQQHPKGIMHIKALVTDGAYVIGSYNWTSAATFENDEILEIGTNDALRKEYEAILTRILAANR